MKNPTFYHYCFKTSSRMGTGRCLMARKQPISGLSQELTTEEGTSSGCEGGETFEGGFLSAVGQCAMALVFMRAVKDAHVSSSY
jgi:hypothetical protein